MTALTAERPFIPQVIGQDWDEYPAAAADLYEGAMIGINSSGYARAYVVGDKFVGHAKASCLNASGSAGDLNVRVYKGIYRGKVALTNVAITDGVQRSAVYATDSGTLSLRVGFMVGRVVRYVSSGIAIVEFDTNPYEYVLSETILYSAMTDDGGTSGRKDFAATLPAGGQVLGWEADVKTGFIGDTTAVIDVGVSGNVNRFSALSTVSVLDAARVGSQGPGATDNTYLTAATTVRVTITGGADFTSVSAGELDLKIRYLPPLA